MPKYFGFYICYFFSIALGFAQNGSAVLKKDTVKAYEPITVTGFQNSKVDNTSLNIEAFSLSKINEKAAFNLSDALAKIPGVSQISTGNAISKPVVRGLYGNRVLVLFSGLRFDNQQWQDEHGLGLSQIGIDRVELIKGPASLLYGSDAIGGVINIVEEKPKQMGEKVDFGTQLFSNTLGSLVDLGYSKKLEKKWMRLRLGFENHGDYSDGKNQRILNSRNRGYYLKFGFGFDKKNWKQENSYNFSYNQYGFIMEDLNTSFDGDARWVRSMNGPHHNVMLNLFNSQNFIKMKASSLQLNFGAQSNLRMEDEGGGQISLNMHLFSLLQNAKWEKTLSPRFNMVLNQQFSYTNNTNYGGRILIPDANLLESNLASYFKYSSLSSKLILEGGLGVNQKHIRTFLTRTLNAPGEPIRPFVKDNVTGNAMFGIVYKIKRKLVLKQNNSTGFRAPNLAELSSNGLHEGVYRYEIGDPKMKLEKNVNSDLSLEFTVKKNFSLSASIYHNYFFNYIYLSPTEHDSFYHFPVYLYKQQNARIKGFELYLMYKPEFVKNIQAKISFNGIKGQLANGNNLPFIPAFKSSTALRWEKNIHNKLCFIEPEYVYVFSQNNPALFETSTKNYYLFNLSTGMTLSNEKNVRKTILSLNMNNIGNAYYYDHLSRLKNYGLHNQGRNIVLSIRKQF